MAARRQMWRGVDPFGAGDLTGGLGDGGGRRMLLVGGRVAVGAVGGPTGATTVADESADDWPASFGAGTGEASSALLRAGRTATNAVTTTAATTAPRTSATDHERLFASRGGMG